MEAGAILGSEPLNLQWRSPAVTKAHGDEQVAIPLVEETAIIRETVKVKVEVKVPVEVERPAPEPKDPMDEVTYSRPDAMSDGAVSGADQQE